MRLVATCWSSHAEGLERQVTEAARGAPGAPHLVEARLDLLARPPSRSFVARLAAAARGRLLVTCRADGPGAPPARADREALLVAALEDGAAAADFEHERGESRPVAPLASAARVVLSLHLGAGDATGQGEFAALAREMAARGCGVVKVATPVSTAAEALDLAVTGRRAIPERVEWAPVAMGPAGTWLRLIAGRTLAATGRPASDLAYVAAARPLPGLGQPLLAEALAAGAADVGYDRPVFGVLGWPLGRTWSPALHGRLWQARGVRAACIPLPARDAAECRRLLLELGLAGAAVTMPHKGAAASAFGLGATLEDPASSATDANTLRRGCSAAGTPRFEAASFDGEAAVAALGGGVAVAGRHVVIVGAGGAARCVAVALLAAGARVTLLARRPKAAAGLIPRGAALVGTDRARGLSADVLVHATPVGSRDVPGMPVPGLLGASLVLDLVTTPAETELVQLARSAGAVVVDGLSVLARQAAAQQRWWSGLAGEEASCLADDAVEHVLRRIVAEADALEAAVDD